MNDTSMGKAWVDAKGKTLYTFGKDIAGKSNCNDKCAVEWPPLQADANNKGSGDRTIVARDGGSKMWAMRAIPSTHLLMTRRSAMMPGMPRGNNTPSLGPRLMQGLIADSHLEALFARFAASTPLS